MLSRDGARSVEWGVLLFAFVVYLQSGVVRGELAPCENVTIQISGPFHCVGAIGRATMRQRGRKPLQRRTENFHFQDGYVPILDFGSPMQVDRFPKKAVASHFRW